MISTVCLPWPTRSNAAAFEASLYRDLTMITLEEFLKRWPGRVDQTTKDEIQVFIDTVTDLSGDYEAFVSRLRATGKFKSIFGDFGANAHRTPNMNYMTNILSSKERAEYPSSLYKTLIAIADCRKPSGLGQALSDVLAKQNPLLDIPGDATHRSLLIPLESCSQGRRKTLPRPQPAAFSSLTNRNNLLRSSSAAGIRKFRHWHAEIFSPPSKIFERI